MDPKSLITVLETNDSLAVTLAKAALKDAGIACRVMGDDPLVLGSPPCSVGQAPFCNGWWWIEVAPEDERQARALLEPLEHPTPFLAEDSDRERE